MKLLAGIILLIAWFVVGEKIGQRMAADEYRNSRDVIYLAKVSRRKDRKATHRLPRYATYYRPTKKDR